MYQFRPALIHFDRMRATWAEHGRIRSSSVVRCKDIAPNSLRGMGFGRLFALVSAEFGAVSESQSRGLCGIDNSREEPMRVSSPHSPVVVGLSVSMLGQSSSLSRVRPNLTMLGL